MARHEEKFKQAADKAARAEILHTEQAGYVTIPTYSFSKFGIETFAMRPRREETLKKLL